MKNLRIYLSVVAFALAIGSVFATKTVNASLPGYEQLMAPFRLGILPPECEYERDCDNIGIIRCKNAFGVNLFRPNAQNICDVPVYDDPNQ